MRSAQFVNLTIKIIKSKFDQPPLAYKLVYHTEIRSGRTDADVSSNVRSPGPASPTAYLPTFGKLKSGHLRCDLDYDREAIIARAKPLVFLGCRGACSPGKC